MSTPHRYCVRCDAGRGLVFGRRHRHPVGLQLVVVLAHDDRAAAGATEAATIGVMTEPVVHRTADQPIPVDVDDNGGTWPGLVLGWRGDRVYVTYSTGIGLKHLTWVPAARVRRR